MTEQARTRESRPRYSYSWYLPAVQTKNQAGNTVLAPPTEVDESGLELLTEEPVQVTEPIPLVKPVGRMPHKLYGKRGIFSNRLRLAAVLGWSAVAATGTATLMLSRHGPAPMLQIGELGATWAGISGFLWLLTSKLSK